VNCISAAQNTASIDRHHDGCARQKRIFGQKNYGQKDTAVRHFSVHLFFCPQKAKKSMAKKWPVPARRNAHSIDYLFALDVFAVLIGVGKDH
jgi:hypothetical protein